jgi:hypothetical protein
MPLPALHFVSAASRLKDRPTRGQQNLRSCPRAVIQEVIQPGDVVHGLRSYT